jgi:hypothetical protein
MGEKPPATPGSATLRRDLQSRETLPFLKGNGCAVLIPELNLDEAGCRHPRSFPNGELTGQQTRSFTLIRSRAHHPRLRRRAVDRSGPTVWTPRSALIQQLINSRVARALAGGRLARPNTYLIGLDRLPWNTSAAGVAAGLGKQSLAARPTVVPSKHPNGVAGFVKFEYCGRAVVVNS